MAGAGQIGRLWVAIGADATELKSALSKTEELVKKTAGVTSAESAKMGDALKKAGVGGEAAARGIDRTGAAAKRAMRPTTALNYTMLRLSQAFVNLRYGNPLGVIAGLAQASASAGRGLAGLRAHIGATTLSMHGLKAAALSTMAVLGGLVALLATVAVAATGVVLGGAAMLTKIGISAAADLETLKIQYEAMLGSAQAAQQEVAYLLELGKTSVVPTENLMEANRQLLAYGITDQKLRQDLINFISDYGSAAGLSTGQIQNLAYAIGQINAQGRALTQDIRQLANASIGVDKLSESLGMTVEQFNEMTAAGKMTADKILPAIIAQADDLGPAADKARESFQGIMNNLSDIAKINIAAAFEDILQKIKPALKWVEEFISAFDFRPIADAISQVMDFFALTVFNGTMDASESAKSFSENFAKAIAIGGQVMAGFVNIVRIAVAQSKVLFNALVLGLSTALRGMLASLEKVAGLGAVIASVVPGLGSVADALNNFRDGVRNFGTDVEGWMGSAVGNIVNDTNTMNDAIGDLFKVVTNFDLDYKRVARGSGSSAGESFAAAVNKAAGVDDDGKGGKGKDDPRFKIWSAWLKEFMKIRDSFVDARKSITDLLRGEFGGPGTLAKALTFGDSTTNFQADADKIISTFGKTKKSISDYYNALGGGENAIFGKKAFKEARAQKNATIGALEAQTQQLVDLANANTNLAKELSDYRENEVRNLEEQLSQTEKVYQGYIAADGKYVKGRIEIANEAYDRAEKAYTEANQKLQSLIAARDSFLDGIRSSARSFVNALSTDADMVQEFRRLDDVGSFAMQEKRKTDSIKEQMRNRLATLKQWAANLATLRSKGLSEDLMRDLIAAGPEASGEAVKELANAGQDSIDEINSIQSELASVTGGIQSQANDMFFASSIAAQQNLVNGLAAQRDAARAAAQAAEEEYHRSRLALEAQIEAVNNGTDQHSLYLKGQMEANATAAATITESITNSLQHLTDDKKNPFSAKNTGKNVINGLIKGLEAKEPKLIATAERIANRVSSTIARALQINSPSKLMYQYGQWVGEGLALGMDSSMAQIDAASIRMSKASLPSLDGAESTAPVVKVFIGDTELRDIVDVQVDQASARDLDTVLSGRRL